MKTRLSQYGIVRLYVIQLVITIIIAVLFALFSSAEAAYSAILGGLICVIPSWLFALRLYRYSGAHAAKKIVASFYAGEMVKLCLTAMLFAIVFYFKVMALPLFVSFIVVQFTFWLAPWILKSKF